MFASKDSLLTRPSGYTIGKSVRLRSSASAYLNRTPSVAGNQQKFTLSAWIKRGTLGNGSVTSVVMSAYDGSSSTQGGLLFDTNDTLTFYTGGSGSYGRITTSAVFRDPSAWYHVVAVCDTTQATATNRMALYINGVAQTVTFNNTPAQNYNGQWNSTVIHTIGKYASGSSNFDGYLTEINFIDGQALTPSSFGTTNAITGVWQPAKYTGAYGTNGFYLNFSDNSAATAATIGKDYSGNGNNWTPNNISVTAGVTYDSMVDSPTVSAVSSNYCVLNPLRTRNSPTISYANLRLDGAGSSHKCAVATFELQGGIKIYAEATVLNTTAGFQPVGFGFTDVLAGATLPVPSDAGGYIFYGNASGNIYNGTTLVTSSLGAPSAGTVLQIAYNPSNGKAWVGKGNVWYNSTGNTTGDPANDTNATFTLSTTLLNVLATAYDTNSLDLNFGQRPFTYTPPTGFVALNTYNLPASTITNGAAYMAATTYTGTGASLTVANTVGSASFQPDWVWVKGRSGATDHALYDSVRGTTIDLVSNSTAAETTQTTGLTAFGSTGFTVGALAKMNTSAATYVAWQWLAGGTSASNTNGTITSTVSAGATQGFSVVTYTGNGTGGATVGHGLGVAPSFILAKGRTNVDNWRAYHSSLGNTGALILNATNAFVTNSTFWNNTSPSSTVVTLGSDTSVNQSSNTFVLYCFAPVAGYSAFGSYTGNGSADGPFVFLGFRPRYVLIKRTDTATAWCVYDTSRNTYNVADLELNPNSGAAENSGNAFDILSNGFKCRDTFGAHNASGGTYVYACFAENPFKNALAR